MAALLLTIVALLPWWRNHGLLREPLDYSLMMRASARIAAGERPYVDFASAQQSGSLWLNAVIERIGGGTYQALTWGNAAAIVGMMLLLGFILRRCFSPAMALLGAAVLVVGTLGQHTIVWYNAIGTLALAVAVLTAAQAPVWHRSSWAWHALTIVALLVGGLNKLNYQAVALAGTCAWVVRAALLGHASMTRSIFTLVGLVLCGTALPLVIELSWTGADLDAWLRNVIIAPAQSRGGLLRQLLSLSPYLAPPHDHYGAVLRPVGLLMVGWLGWTVVGLWRGRSGLDRLLLLTAAAFVITATMALLLTNLEINYLALSAGFALLLSLWIGFGPLPLPQTKRAISLWLPAVLAGLIMWGSAWSGQRALFGSDRADRATFRELNAADERFAYFAGTRLPPNLADDIETLVLDLPRHPPNAGSPYLYATGTEWLERIYPVDSLHGLPLLLTGVGLEADRMAQLKTMLAPPGPVERVFGISSWVWPGDLEAHVKLRGPLILRGRLKYYDLRPTAPPLPLSDLGDSIELINQLGSGMDPNLVHLNPIHPVRPLRLPSGQHVLGITSGTGAFQFARPSKFIRGEVRLARTSGSTGSPLSARFTVSHAGRPDLPPFWSADVRLPAGETETTMSYDLDAANQPTRFAVTVADDYAEQLHAGWRMPQIYDSRVDTPTPPQLRRTYRSETTLESADRLALLPPGWAERAQVVVRGGTMELNSLHLPAGGEGWIRLDDYFRTMRVRVRNPDANPQIKPVVRVLWYRGGRIEMITQREIPAEGEISFDAWMAEYQGWVAVLVDPNPEEAKVRLQIEYIDDTR